MGVFMGVFMGNMFIGVGAEIVDSFSFPVVLTDKKPAVTYLERIFVMLRVDDGCMDGGPPMLPPAPPRNPLLAGAPGGDDDDVADAESPGGPSVGGEDEGNIGGASCGASSSSLSDPSSPSPPTADESTHFFRTLS